MKEYFYEKDGKQFGPVQFDNLTQAQITVDTLIWHEGLSEWMKAKDIQELSDILKKTPPPLPTKRQIVQTNKYDQTYKKETDASWAGFAFLALPLLLTMMGVFSFNDEQSYRTAKVIGSFISLVYRIIITFWVTGIAKRQNRDTLGWGIFAFFVPTLALIIIGFLNRLNKPGQLSFAELQINETKTPEEKIISDKEFKQQDNLLKTISFVLIIVGILATILLIAFG